MPARSEAQRRYLYSKFGAAWVKRHHFDNRGKLPGHVANSNALMSAHKRKAKR